MEAVINRARSLLSYLAPQAAMVYLQQQGVDAETSYLAVKAAKILGEYMKETVGSRSTVN